MSTYESFSHAKWDCKYHIVFVPKGRKKELYGTVRQFLGSVFHELAAQRRSAMLEGHLGQDHVHMLIRIPPTYAVAEVVGDLKGNPRLPWLGNLGGASAIATAKPSGREVMRSPRWDVKKSTCAVISATRSSSMLKAGMKTVTSKSRCAR